MTTAVQTRLSIWKYGKESKHTRPIWDNQEEDRHHRQGNAVHGHGVHEPENWPHGFPRQDGVTLWESGRNTRWREGTAHHFRQNNSPDREASAVKTVLHLSTLWLSRASLITRLVCEQKIAWNDLYIQLSSNFWYSLTRNCLVISGDVGLVVYKPRLRMNLVGIHRQQASNSWYRLW